MILHREYLNYPTNRYIVTFEGDKLRTMRQEIRIRIESVVRGNRRPPILCQGEGTVEALKSFAKWKADNENPGASGRWHRFSGVFQDGEYREGGGLTPQITVLLNECGPMARHQLESGAEPEIVALCGGLENALAVLKYCEAAQGGAA